MSGQRTVDLKLDLATREVLRVLGGSQGAPICGQTLDRVTSLVTESQPHLRARATYAMCSVSHYAEHHVAIGALEPMDGSVSRHLRGAGRAAVFAATLGEGLLGLMQRYQSAGGKDEVKILQGIGELALEATADALIEHLWAREAGPDEAVTPYYRPGYCGLPLTYREMLLSLVDSKPIGVSLLSDLSLRPMHSLNGLAGIGNAEQISPHIVPCEECTTRECRAHRRPPSV